MQKKGLHKKSLCWCMLLLLCLPSKSKAADFSTLVCYDSLITQKLQQASLPPYCKMLPVLLANGNPEFQNDFCAGFWALTAPVAAHYGLRMTADYDERFDIELATTAAVNYLSDLWKEMGDNEQNAIKQYAKVCIFDKSDTIRYKYESNLLFGLQRLMVAYPFHPIAARTEPLRSISIEHAISIGDFCRAMHLDSLYFMQSNLPLRTSAIVLRPGYKVNVPQKQFNFYAQNTAMVYRDSVTNKPPEAATTVVAPIVTKPAPPKYILYRIKPGDTLGHIAMRYKVGVSQLKKWNSLRSDFIPAGKTLKIYTK